MTAARLRRMESSCWKGVKQAFQGNCKEFERNISCLGNAERFGRPGALPPLFAVKSALTHHQPQAGGGMAYGHRALSPLSQGTMN